MARRLSLQLLHTAYGLGQDTIPLWTGPVLQGVMKQTRTSQARSTSSGTKQGVGSGGGTQITLTFTAMSSAGGIDFAP